MCSLSPFLFISSLSLLYNKNNKNIMQSHSLYCHRGGKESGLFQYVRKSYCPLLFISLPLTICLEVLSSYKYKSTKTHHWMKSKHSAFFVTYYSSVDKDSFKNKKGVLQLILPSTEKTGGGEKETFSKCPVTGNREGVQGTLHYQDRPLEHFHEEICNKCWKTKIFTDCLFS